MSVRDPIAPAPDLAIVLLALDEASNLDVLLPACSAVTKDLNIDAKVVVVDGSSGAATAREALAHGATVVSQTRRGYGAALRDGFVAAAGAPFVLTMNADLSHPPALLHALWPARLRADVAVASRYVPGGRSKTSWTRHILSRIMNRVFSRALSVPVRDLSSGYRLYRRRVVESLPMSNDDLAVLPEILVRAYAEGYHVTEVPFHAAADAPQGAAVRLARFGRSYVKTLWRLWCLRNSISSADYDSRAFDSIIPLQRYWQRARHRIICDFAADGGRILDVGCGSSRILQDLPGAVGVDVLLRKLRFLRAVHPEVAQASIFALPFCDASFDTVICSEVIEHIADDPKVLGELTRVLRPGGTLILGTPDYGRLLWHVIEWLYRRVAPGGYAHEHVTHFDRAGLEARLAALGYVRLECRYVGACEMIFKTRKQPGGTAAPASGGIAPDDGVAGR